MTSRADVPGVASATTPSSRFPDPQIDRAFRDLRDRLDRLSALPMVPARIIADVELADGVATPIEHLLGRPAAWVRESCPRGAVTSGRVEEVTDSSYDPAQYVILKASGWGATITVNLAVL